MSGGRWIKQENGDYKHYTDEEYTNEQGGKILAGCFLFVIGVLFVLSPGIIITSILNLMFDFTSSQLWWSSIICTIIVVAIMYFTIGLSLKNYCICAGICAGFIIILTLITTDNIFWNTTKGLFDFGSDKVTMINESDMIPQTEQKTYQFISLNS